MEKAKFVYTKAISNLDAILAFILVAIAKGKEDSAAKGKEYKGIHTVYSGLNEEIRVLFAPADSTPEERKAFPVAAIDALVKNGKLAKRYAFGGALVYLASEAPAMQDRTSPTVESIMAKYKLSAPPVIPPATKPTRRASAPKTAA